MIENRRAAIAAVLTVSGIFFVIRLGILFLSRETMPRPSTTIGDRSRPSTTVPPTPEETKRDARAKILMLATEAREEKATKTQASAYDADRALEKDDCAAATTALARSGEGIAEDSRLHGAHETASRAVDAYCAALRDR